ncbi:MAG: M17 family peptidase N-terminal domain-containing protein [Deltaproteobacteria bacterium]|nr:M17 family peptidase N-terminal domain-containing protein [Deltaproteobacteria bacterium]
MVKEASCLADKVDAEILALPFFEDERPLRGASGLVDWRMNGALSRLILQGAVSGLEGESLLMSTDGRISAPRLLLFGLGDSKIFDGKRFQGLLSQFVKTVARLKFTRLAIAIPGSSLFSMGKVGDVVKKEFEKAGMPDDTEIIIIG